GTAPGHWRPRTADRVWWHGSRHHSPTVAMSAGNSCPPALRGVYDRSAAGDHRRLVRTEAPGARPCDGSDEVVRAVILPEPGRFELTEVPDPIPGPREVLVEVAAVGICGTDIHVLDGDFEPTVYPLIPGHETSAVVRAVGEQVSEVAPGDRVSVDPTLTCGECPQCTVGRSNLCDNWNGAGVGRTDGSIAELMVAPVRNVHPLPDGVDLELAALIEPLSCAIHGFDLLPRRMGEHYLVYGAGTMGLMMAQLAPRAGAASVTIVDRN